MFLVSLSVLCHGEFFVLSDNLRILCFSCDAKMSKITAKLFKKSRNKRRSNCFYGVMCDPRAYNITVFLTVAQHESGTLQKT
jgi:hypothetical protein